MMIVTMLMISFEDNNKMPSFLSIHHLVFISFGGENALFMEWLNRCVASYIFFSFLFSSLFSVSQVISFLKQEKNVKIDAARSDNVQLLTE